MQIERKEDILRRLRAFRQARLPHYSDQFTRQLMRWRCHHKGHDPLAESLAGIGCQFRADAYEALLTSYASTIEAYREILPTLLRQLKNPEFFFRRELPASARPYRAVPSTPVSRASLITERNFLTRQRD